MINDWWRDPLEPANACYPLCVYSLKYAVSLCLFRSLSLTLLSSLSGILMPLICISVCCLLFIFVSVLLFCSGFICHVEDIHESSPTHQSDPITPSSIMIYGPYLMHICLLLFICFSFLLLSIVGGLHSYECPSNKICVEQMLGIMLFHVCVCG